jgi:HEAT repeat
MSSISTITFTYTTVLLDTNQEISITINSLGEVLDYKPFWYELPSALRQLTLSESQHEALADLLDNYHERLTYALPLMTLDYCRNYKEELPEGAKSVQCALQAAWPSDWERGKYEGHNEWQQAIEAPNLNGLVYNGQLIFVRYISLLLGNERERKAAEIIYYLQGELNLAYIPLLGISGAAGVNLSDFTGTPRVYEKMLPKLFQKNAKVRRATIEALLNMKHLEVTTILCEYLEQQLLPEDVISSIISSGTDIRLTKYFGQYFNSGNKTVPSSKFFDYDVMKGYFNHGPDAGTMIQQLCEEVKDEKRWVCLSVLADSPLYQSWVEVQIIKEISVEKLPLKLPKIITILTKVASPKSIPFLKNLLNTLMRIEEEYDNTEVLQVLIPIWRKLNIPEPAEWTQQNYYSSNTYILIPLLGKEIIAKIGNKLETLTDLNEFPGGEYAIRTTLEGLLKEGSKMSIEIIFSALNSPIIRVAESAMYLLSRAQWPQIEHTYLRFLDQPALRVTALTCLCWLQPDNVTHTIHQKLLTWNDAESKIWGWFLLGCLGDARAVKPLCTYVKVGDDEAMKLRIIFLCAQRQYTESAESLYALLKQRNTLMEGMILYALGQLRYEPIRQELQDRIDLYNPVITNRNCPHKDQFINYHAYRGLLGFGEDIAQKAVESMKSPKMNPDILHHHFYTRLKSGDEAGINYFKRGLSNRIAPYRKRALKSFEVADDPIFIDFIIPLLSDPFADVREAAIETLAAIGTNIGNRTMNESEKSVALQRIHQLLTKMTQDTEVSVRKMAAYKQSTHIRQEPYISANDRAYSFYSLMDEENFPPLKKSNFVI